MAFTFLAVLHLSPALVLAAAGQAPVNMSASLLAHAAVKSTQQLQGQRQQLMRRVAHDAINSEALRSIDMMMESNAAAEQGGLDADTWMEMSRLQLLGPEQAPQVPYAVVTHICSDLWAPGALALAASLNMSGSKVEHVVMLSHQVTPAYHELMRKNFHRVYVEEVIKEHAAITRNSADCLTLQLRTWQLPYQKALYMDADMIALKPPDDLFKAYGELTAKMDQKGRGFNGGMFMCQPGTATFDKLRNLLKEFQGDPDPLHKEGMQDFMNFAFPRCEIVQRLPYKPAGCLGEIFPRENNFFARDLTAEEAAAVATGSKLFNSLHFSGDWSTQKKPWMKGCLQPASSTTLVEGDETHGHVLDIWMNAFKKVHAVPAAARLIDCPYAVCPKPASNMDFVVHASTLDCVTEMVLQRLFKYAAPRRILLIASYAECSSWIATKQGLDNVQCVDEQKVLPSVSLSSIKEWLRHKFATEGDAKNEQTAVALALQYFSRFLKMGIAQSGLDLSDQYSVWDSDVILLRNFCPFNKLGQAVLMEGDVGQTEQCHNDKNLLRQMTGVDFFYSQRNKTFAANQAVMDRQIMTQLLQKIADNSAQKHWSMSILENACKTFKACKCGFSEYGWYTSWLRHKHPDSNFEEVKPLYRHFSPNMLLSDDNELIAGLVSNTAFPGKRPPCCPQDLYDFAGFWGNRDIGMGHQFVRFTRECPTRIIDERKGRSLLAQISDQHKGPAPPQLKVALEDANTHVSARVKPHARSVAK